MFAHICWSHFLTQTQLRQELLWLFPFNLYFVRFIFAFQIDDHFVFFIFYYLCVYRNISSLNFYAHFPNNPIQSMKTNFVFSNILRCFWFSFAKFPNNTQQCLDDVRNRCNDNGITKKIPKYTSEWLEDRRQLFWAPFFLFSFSFFFFGFDEIVSWAMNSERWDAPQERERERASKKANSIKKHFVFHVNVIKCLNKNG